MMHDDSCKQRVVITAVQPAIDGGSFPIKRIVGEPVVVTADIFVDGHDSLAGRLLYRAATQESWAEIALVPLGNDRWQGAFPVTQLGLYYYTVQAWIDSFTTWQLALGKKVRAGQEVSIDLLIGAQLLHEASQRATGADIACLQDWSARLRTPGRPAPESIALALSTEVAACMETYPDRRCATSYHTTLPVLVDRPLARFSTWYEMFPRSCSPAPGQHGTFADCEARLPYIAQMGFDVLYLPPIHPIGEAYRKGKNNTIEPEPDDVGSPWAIGAAAGGHKAIHPQLGTLEDFRHFVAKARTYGIEVALDLAFQCSPDHPYVTEHPEWFRKRPDGSIQYAENPPKQYQDIYPFDFESADWRALWEELKDVVLYWIAQGVTIFRVDNPHTKPLRFWEWLIAEVKQQHPDILFLSEAFTRPKVMYHLAKIGFTQSYTYFTWRNTKEELRQYLTELTQTDVREYFRPNFWPNTPDILNEYLQFGGRPAFVIRLMLAATLAANYGIYGPAFELLERHPREAGSEEYLDSEKYQLRYWDLQHPESLRDLLARVNRIRRDNPALYSNTSLRFHEVANDALICYSKANAELSNIILVVVNLDPHHQQTGWLNLDLTALGLDSTTPYQVHDLIGDARFLWQGPHNYVDLHPQVMPAHIFRVRRRIRTEHDFDYYL